MTRKMRTIRLAAIALAGVLAVSDSAWAQPGGGRRGGGFNFGGGAFAAQLGLVGPLFDEAVRTELKITEEQWSKVQEAAQAMMPNPQAMLGRFRQDMTEEERAAVVSELQKEAEVRRVEGNKKLAEILSPEQFKRLGEIELQRVGPAALSRAEMAEALKLTEDQTASIKKLNEEYSSKMRALGFRATREEREKLSAEQNAALLGVLTDEQKTVWEASQGAPFAAAAPTGGAPATAGSGTGATPAPAAVPRPTVTETVPAGATVVADFSPQPQSAASVEDKKMSFKFRFAPWKDVLEYFAKEAELTLDLTVVPTGTFNYVDNAHYSVTESLDILNGYLLQKGYILVRRDRFLVVLDLAQPIPPNLVPTVAPEDLSKRGKNELMTLVLTLKDIRADEAARDVEPLLGPQGKVASLANTNRLVVTDIGQNLQRIYSLLMDAGQALVDERANGFRKFVLKNVSAYEAERQIRDLFGLASRTTTTTTSTSGGSASSGGGSSRDAGRGRDSRDRGGFDRGGFDRGGFQGFQPGGFAPGGFGPGGFFQPQGQFTMQAQPQPQSGGATRTGPNTNANANARINVTVDSRTNSLLVVASNADLKLVEELITAIDADDPAAAQAAREGQPQLEVYPIRNSDPESVASMLNTLLPGLTLNVDAKSRKVHVFAAPSIQTQVRALMQQLDGEGGGETVAVIPLVKHDPVAVSTTLRSMFANRGADPPSIEANALGRQLMVRGTPDQLNEIRALLKGMGEDGTGRLNFENRTRVRELPLNGRDPDELIGLLDQMMQDRRGGGIRIVVPSDRGPVLRREVVPRTQELQAPPEGARPEAPAGDAPRTPAETRPTSRPVPARSTSIEHEQERPTAAAEPCGDEELAFLTADAGPWASGVGLQGKTEWLLTAGSAEAVQAEAQGDAPTVRIDVNSGNLILYSNDLDALDEIEELVSELTRIPVKPRWTVFYLRVADASEAATMLGSLFPAGSVSNTGSSEGSGILGSLGSGLNALGGNLMDMTGLSSLATDAATLRIVPEPRSNALFVTGPPDQVREVEEVLRILDSNELPESLKDRVPRRIPVMEADVEEVAAIVEDLYRDYMEGGNGPGGGGGGRGGRGGGGGGLAGLNPLAMLMGQAGGGNQRGIRLTLGVDTRSNTLIVSSDESTFNQIEMLVKSLDESAKANRRTVQIVTVRNSNSSVVQEALTSLLQGQQSDQASATGRRGDQGNPFGQFPQGQNPFGQRGTGGRGGEDAARQFFRDRMLEGAGLNPGGVRFGPGGGGFQGGGFQGGGFQGGGFQGGGFQGGRGGGGFGGGGGGGRGGRGGR